MDQFARRPLLEAASNSHERLDFLVTLAGPFVLAGRGPATLRLRYVPDRRILKPEAFDRYLASLAAGPAAGLESVAAAVLDDINNELVPRWVQVSVSTAGPSGTSQAVVLEDRQPRWDNATLLARAGTH